MCKNVFAIVLISAAGDSRNRSELVSILADWLRLDQETAEHTYSVFIKSLSKDGTLSRVGMEALINERKRQVKYTGDVPSERVFDFSIVDEINREAKR